jgi:hypothetical protein
MKERTITIAKKDIFFDVDAQTHVFARATEGSNLKRADALEADSADTMAGSLLTRYADQRIGELEERISRFLKTPTSAVTSAAAAIGTATSYTMTLYVETGFQDELLDPLAKAMEKYVAHGVTADWYTAAGDALGGVYLQMLPGDLARIQEYLVKRKTPSRS